MLKVFVFCSINDNNNIIKPNAEKKRRAERDGSWNWTDDGICKWGIPLSIQFRCFSVGLWMCVQMQNVKSARINLDWFPGIDVTPPQMNRMKIELQYRSNQNKLNLPNSTFKMICNLFYIFISVARAWFFPHFWLTHQ